MRMDKMESKLDGKCQKKLEWANKLCSVSDKADCDKWALAQQAKCEANGEARIANRNATAKCMAEFKHMMAAFKNDDIVPRADMTIAEIGDCFSDALVAAKAIIETAEDKYEDAMEGVTEFSEEELAEAKNTLQTQRKAERKEKRQQMKKNRRGKRKQWR